MFNSSGLRVTVTALALCALVGACSVVRTIRENCSSNGDGTYTCQQKAKASKTGGSPITAADVASFNAAHFAADLSQSNVQLVSATATGSIIIRQDGAIKASMSFPLTRSGNMFSVSNPISVTNWVKANAPGGTEVEVEIGGVKIGAVAGANIYSLVAFYMDDEVHGFSDSWHVGPLDPVCCSLPY